MSYSGQMASRQAQQAAQWGMAQASAAGQRSVRHGGRRRPHRVGLFGLIARLLGLVAMLAFLAVLAVFFVAVAGSAGLI
jgi:hypothetical protein